MDLDLKDREKSKTKVLDIQEVSCLAAGNLCPLTPHVLQMQEFGFVSYPLCFMF